MLSYKKGPSLLPVLITELPTLVEQQIKTNAFYTIRCHYPLRTYLSWNVCILFLVCTLLSRLYPSHLASFIQAWNDFGDLKAAGRQEKRCIWLHCKASVGANIFLAYIFFTFFFLEKNFAQAETNFFEYIFWIYVFL